VARASHAARTSGAARAARGGASAKIHPTKAGANAKGKAGAKPRTRKVELRIAALSAERSHLGDHSFTFKAPGLERSDAFSLAAPVALARYSPIASAMALDGAYLRAIFGSIATLLPLVGFIVGLAAGISSQGLTEPFSLLAFTCIMLAGLFDGAIGLFASFGLLLTTLIEGTFFSLSGFTTMVIVAALWSGLGVMVGRVRLFVKDRPEHLAAWYERLGDMVIGSLLLSYLALKFIELLNGPSSSLAPIAAKAQPLALALLLATIIKYLATTAVSHFYPRRLMKVYPVAEVKRSRPVRITSTILKALGAYFVFTTFLGLNWLVITLLALYLADVVLPDLIQPTEEPSWLGLLIPANLGKVLVLSMASAVAILALQPFISSGERVITVSLIVVMILATVISVATARWPEPREVPSAVLYIGGFAIAALTLLQLTNHLIVT